MNETKKIGIWTCTALVVGNVIGMGIFLLPASLAPFGFNALIGWGIVIVGCLTLARVFSHLARAMPDADGPYGYIRQTLGDLPAYMAMWAYWISCWLSNAAIATGVVGYIAIVFPQADAMQPALLALLLLWSMVVVNLFGVRTGGAVQIVTTVLKLLPMVAIAILGAWVLLTTPESYVAHPPTAPITLGGVMAAMTIALFAMLGFESASVPASRVEDPAHTVPRATMIGTVIVAVVYIIVSTVPLLLIPEGELAEAGAPFALLMERFGQVGSGRWLALFVVVSGLGALNGWTLLVGEMTRTMAINGVLPNVLSRNNRRGAPMFALLLSGALGSLMIAMSYSQSLVAAFTFLTRVVTAANLPLYLACSLGLIALCRRGAGHGTGRAVLASAVIGLAFVIFAFVGIGGEPFLYALGLIAAGLPLYAWMRMHRKMADPIKI
ncbi:amino acid permease [Dokdonella immobilis]|uniref:Arginine/agmatine antiporter n=1 Tax=Dokdonella immobilis TaxID=578942 RepID=A0A1I4X3H1_9GAMM|nr:amino acid permease [Dokdonella immobilis]SFN19779.1 amino acid/polyamine/organocation transporter, APC superfamily [Dokdonella immobilis]